MGLQRLSETLNVIAANKDARLLTTNKTCKYHFCHFVISQQSHWLVVEGTEATLTSRLSCKKYAIPASFYCITAH